MKKFVFTLQSLYGVTLSTEKQQKLQLKKTEARLVWLEEGLEKMKSEYLEYKVRCAKEMEEGISADELSQYNIYFDCLFNLMVEQKDHILRTEAERDRCRAALVKTRRKVQTLEKVKESQYEAYLQEIKIEQEKDMGDLVAYRAAAR
ncbi:MAG: flagellar export protein FliJ [Christensenellales bacterium]|jgi:flagellar export protein FliJ